MLNLVVVRAAVSASVVAAALSCSGGDKASPDATSTGIPRTTEESGAIDWEDCFEIFDCGELAVPIDYSEPDGDEMTIAVVRRPAPRRGEWSGALLVNPGGPGGSGFQMALDAEYFFPREIIDRFDIIGFDPRGVGQSEPVDCGDSFDDEYPVDYTPDNAAERLAIEDDAREYAEECVRRNSDILPFISTLNTARDMDVIREALGVEQISFFGQSYGTLLGAQYAELFPERVRAFVLDGGVDPGLEFDQAQEEQAEALELALNAFLDDCASSRACDFYSEGDPHAAFDELMSEIEDEPIRAPLWEEGTVVTPDDASRAVVSAMYSRDAWVQLAYALVEAHRDNDGSGLLDLAYPYSEDTEESIYGDANNAILCADLPTDDDAAHFHDLSERFQEEWPRAGAVAAYWSLPCAEWPAPAEPMPRSIDAEDAAPILVVGTTVDPATPYEWSVRLTDALDSGHLLTYEGNGHTAAFALTSRCVDDAALRYLVDLELPDDDRCVWPE